MDVGEFCRLVEMRSLDPIGSDRIGSLVDHELPLLLPLVFFVIFLF